MTGGAAAAYGSGGLAEVINILLDADFIGMELTGQAGLTNRRDRARYKADVAFRTKLA